MGASQERVRCGGRGPMEDGGVRACLSPSLSSGNGLCVPHLPVLISPGKSKLVATSRVDSLNDWLGMRMSSRIPVLLL